MAMSSSSVAVPIWGSMGSKRKMRGVGVLQLSSLPLWRNLSSESSAAGDIKPEERVQAIEKAIQDFGAKHIEVKDTSGGCGAFFNVLVVSSKFEGMNRLKREREMHKLLKNHIQDIHGIQLRSI
eukprot:1392688-Amorphochlora_amoeboformis.AAC.3